MSARENKFQKAYASARTALIFTQRRRNALYNTKVHGPTNELDQKVLLQNSLVPVGKLPKFFSPWKGPYVILQSLNDVTYGIQELATDSGKNLLFFTNDSNFLMNHHRPQTTLRLIGEILKINHHRKFSKNNKLRLNMVKISDLALSVPYRHFN